MLNNAILITAFVLSQHTIMDYGIYDNIHECTAMIEALQQEYTKAARTEEIYCMCVEIEKQGEEV